MREYYFGYKKQIHLIDNDNTFIFSTIRYGGSKVKIIGSKTEKKVISFEQDGRYVNIDSHGELLRKNVIEQILEDGSRWEGDLYDNKPFGFGCYYDGEGRRVYSGFIFEGKKIGFGTEYFPDNFKVDYCGNFLNDKRHGWGTTYDRNGRKLYKGDWVKGNNDINSTIVIDKNCSELEDDCENLIFYNSALMLNECDDEYYDYDDDDDDEYYEYDSHTRQTIITINNIKYIYQNGKHNLFHNLVTELVFDEGSCNRLKFAFVISDLPQLTRIVVKSNSFFNITSFTICNNIKLKSLEIEHAGSQYNKGSFLKASTLIMDSMRLLPIYTYIYLI